MPEIEKEDREEFKFTTRIALLERDMQQALPLFKKLDESLNKLSEIMAELRTSGRLNEQRIIQIDKTLDDKEIETKDKDKDIEKRLIEIEKRVSKLEQWRYYVIGLSVALFAVVSTVVKFLAAR